MTIRKAHALPLAIAALAVSIVACGEDTDGTLPGTPLLCDPISTTDTVVENSEDLRSVEGRVEVEGDLIFCSIAGITEISLPDLTRVGGNVLIYNNTDLTTVDLPMLTSMGESSHEDRPWKGFLIDLNPALDSLTVPMLRHVDGHIWLGDNAALTDVDFPGLARVGSSITFKSTAMTSINGFNELLTVGNGLLFFFNESLTAIGGFASLTTISNDIMLLDNAAVTSLSLPALRFVGRLLSVEGSTELATLDLAMLEVVGNNLLLDDTGLTDLSGLAGLELVGNDLSLLNNAEVTTVELPLLGSVGASLTVQENALATDVTLSMLTLVGDDLRIEDNAVLAGLDFSALVEIGGNLVVRTNATLPTCAAEAVRDTVTEASIGGAVSITGNDDAGLCP